MDNRLNRKIYITGVTMRLMFANTSATANNYQRFRVILIRAHDGSESTQPRFDVPVGATRGLRVLYDKQFVLQSTSSTNGRSVMNLNKFIKVNADVAYDGSEVDGTDTDNGTVRCIILLEGPTSQTDYHGSWTVHYKDLAN